MVIGARNLAFEALAAWQAASPSMIKLQVDPPMSDEELLALKKIEGIAEIEGQMSASFEWRLTPEQEWQVGFLSALSGLHQIFIESLQRCGKIENRGSDS